MCTTLSRQRECDSSPGTPALWAESNFEFVCPTGSNRIFCPLCVTGVTVEEPEGSPALHGSSRAEALLLSVCTAPSTVPGIRQISGTSPLMQKLRKVTGSLRPLKQLQLLSGATTAGLRAQGTGDESLLNAHGCPQEEARPGRTTRWEGAYLFISFCLSWTQGGAQLHLTWKKQEAQGTGIAHSQVNEPIHQQLEKNEQQNSSSGRPSPTRRSHRLRSEQEEEKHRRQEYLESSIPNEASSHHSAPDLASAPSC